MTDFQRRTVLLTGGRAPATLELARLFGLAGHRVLVGDSVPFPVAGWSRAVTKRFRWPSPRFSFTAFKNALLNTIDQEGVDLLIPTCEEIYFIAAFREKLEQVTVPFVPDLKRLTQLHSKMTFIDIARSLNLTVPETVRVTAPDRLTDAWNHFDQQVVLKPEFSRFATQTIILPTRDKLRGCHPTPDRPWVVQAYLAGKPYASYSVFQAGKMVLHTDYEICFTAGQGAAISFQPACHPEIARWVSHFGAGLGLTGQLAFDFIDADQLYAIECNPRLTSGIHLLRGRPEAADAYWAHAELPIPVAPLASSRAYLGLPLWGNLPAALRDSEQRSAWHGMWRSGQNILFDPADIRPWLLQGVSMLPHLATALRRRLSPIAATTADIEWNGGEIR